MHSHITATLTLHMSKRKRAETESKVKVQEAVLKKSKIDYEPDVSTGAEGGVNSQSAPQQLCETTDHETTTVDNKDKKRRHGLKRDKALEIALSSAWNITAPIGGHLLDLDPIFSHDEQYVGSKVNRSDYSDLYSIDISFSLILLASKYTRLAPRLLSELCPRVPKVVSWRSPFLNATGPKST